MKGLLIKEFLNMKLYAKILAFLFFLFLLLNLFQKSTLMLIGMLSIFPVLLVLITAVNSIALDDASKWNCLAAAMPLRRRDIVKSKYLYLILLSFGINILAFLVSLGFNILFPTPEFWSSTVGFVGGFCTTLLMLSILMPLLYKFGAEKSRLIVIAVVMLPSLLMGILSSMIQFPDLSAIRWENYAWIVWILPWFLLLAYGFSYLLSVRIFCKKDL